MHSPTTLAIQQNLEAYHRGKDPGQTSDGNLRTRGIGRQQLLLLLRYCFIVDAMHMQCPSRLYQSSEAIRCPLGLWHSMHGWAA